MPLSARTLKRRCVAGVLVILGQGALSFSDVDAVGWALVVGYLALG